MKERSSFTVGEQATLTKEISNGDIWDFARISGDTNPIHLNHEYASKTMFKGRIAHGILVTGLISAVVGTILPGPGSIYLSQQVKFLAPVRPNDVITAWATVTAWDEKRGRVTLLTEAINQDGVIVITGEAVMIMSSFLKKGE